MIFRIIFWLLLIGILFRFVFRFFLPVVQLTKMTHKQVRRMQEQLKHMTDTASAPSRPVADEKNTAKQGEYIDYEEVR